MAPESEAVRFSLSPLVMSPADVSRLRRELTALDEYLRAQGLREPGIPVERLPKLSRTLDEFAETNKVNLLHETARHDLEQFLTNLEIQAPIIHISFAADPSSASLQKVVLWLRQNIHQNVLVRVGLQPAIVAGCVVRTTNHYFDFSLRHYFQEHHADLVEAIKLPVAAPQEVSNE